MSRSRTQALVLAGAALTLLLGIVAFVSRGHSSPGGGGTENRGASQALANSIFTFWFVAMAFGALMLLFVLANRRRMRKEQGAQRARPFAFGILLLVLVVLALTLGRRLPVFQHGANGRPNGIASMRKALRKAERKREHQHKIKDPSFQWPLALAIIALIAGATLTAFFRAKAKRGELVSEAAFVEEIRGMLDETLDDLRREVDPRKAVIAAYARMERTLGVHGLPRRPSEAPQEYLERVLAELQVTKPAVERLTELFARAKFSQHDVDPRMKDDAIDALVRLREQIRAIDDSLVDKPALRPSAVPGGVR